METDYRMKMRLVLSIVLLSGIVGCSPFGYVYNNTTRPLTYNMHSTPIGTKMATLDSRRIKEPITGLNMTIEWNSRAIGDAAKRQGIDKIYYADLNTFSLLGGLWEQKTIRVWGD